MRIRIISVLTMLGLITFLVNCASTPKSQKLFIIQLDGLYVTMDASQMSGKPKDTAKLDVGDTIIIYARGKSSKATGNKWLKLPAKIKISWSVDKELKITQNQGHTVAVKVVTPISTAAYVSAGTAITRLTKINYTTGKATLEFSSVSKKFKIEGK